MSNFLVIGTLFGLVLSFFHAIYMYSLVRTTSINYKQQFGVRSYCPTYKDTKNHGRSGTA